VLMSSYCLSPCCKLCNCFLPSYEMLQSFRSNGIWPVYLTAIGRTLQT
jgi:hypothetical protein